MKAAGLLALAACWTGAPTPVAEPVPAIEELPACREVPVAAPIEAPVIEAPVTPPVIDLKPVVPPKLKTHLKPNPYVRVRLRALRLVAGMR